jgi:hypothetical protein
MKIVLGIKGLQKEIRSRGITGGSRIGRTCEDKYLACPLETSLFSSIKFIFR